MPIIDIPLDLLMARINVPGSAARFTEKDLAERLPRIGCAIEEFADMHQYACRRCDKIFDRTEAQGKPLHCTNCGSDFRASPDLLGDMGKNRVVRFELLAVRTDIYDPGGMGRLVRGYLGAQPGLIEYPLSPPKITVKVDPRLSDDASRRPYIACAVLRNVQFDHGLIKMLMNLQEDLHWALGRDRKLASIGVYDLDTLRGTTFRYDAIAPDGLRFIPLGFSPDQPNSALTPAEILEKHPTGQAYAHLLKSMAAYPLLRDESGTVLSMPPIINSESTRVTLRSKQLFVDVTGLSRRVVERALNVLVTSLKELLPSVEIEQVLIDAPDGKRATPDLTPVKMTLDVQQAADTIGVALDAPKLGALLERMGHGVSTAASNANTGDKQAKLNVHVPAWRNDIMHPVDLIEDAAVAYGYENLTPTLVPTFTVGAPRLLEEQCAVVRKILTGLGFHQVMTLVLTSEPAAFGKWRLPADPRAVVIDNPISTEQTIARVSLLPGLLETLAINKQYDLPQQIFEVGDCSFLDETVETGAREERYLAAALIGTHAGYADIRAVADAFAHEMGVSYVVKPMEHPSFIPSRVAALLDGKGRQIGVMGELHPEVLENYGLKHAAVVMELSLEKLLET